MTIEGKVVIVLKNNRGTIGVQSTDSDPIIVPFQGGLDIALQMVPDVVEAAHQQWILSRRYPATEKPAAPEPAARATAQASSQRTSRSAPSTTQQRMF